MSKAIAITSGKGGVGKSTTAVNLGVGLADAGLTVALVDMDIGLRSLDIMLGMENDVVFDLVDVAEGTCDMEQALLKDKKRPRLTLLPAAQMREAASVNTRDMARIVDRLKEQFDIVLLDCPAGIGRGMKNTLCAADEIILVVTPDAICLRDAERMTALIQEMGAAPPRLLINRVARKNGADTDALIHRLSLYVLGFIPEDRVMIKSSRDGRPAIERPCRAGDAYERVINRMLGENVRYRIPHEGLIHKIRTGFGKEAACRQD